MDQKELKGKVPSPLQLMMKRFWIHLNNANLSNTKLSTNKSAILVPYFIFPITHELGALSSAIVYPSDNCVQNDVDQCPFCAVLPL